MNHTATYSPEDNKLRLHPACRLSQDDYETIKAAGFKWAAKQELFVAPAWSPSREDALLELVEEIGDEDYSPEERSADRAERFSGYRDRRAAEATGHADTFDAGPACFGNQSQARAERQSRRHDRHRTHAVSQWGKAEYWQMRTEGVIRHALYKSSAPVRRSRIKRLEAEQRKHDKGRQEYAARFAAWQKVLTLDGKGETLVSEDGNLYCAKSAPAVKLAYTLANSSGCWGEYTHPRTGRTAASLYSLLTDPEDKITAEEAANLWLANRRDPADPDSHSARWSNHYALRLTYERAMLDAEGGTAAAAEMEPGGWILASNRTGSVFTDVSGGWMQIHGVTRSPATGLVTSVKVMGTRGYSDPKPALVSINIERLGEKNYRPPTDEERQQFAQATKARKAEAKAAKKPEPALLNPTAEDAEKLQALFNQRAKAHYDKLLKEGRRYKEWAEDAEVWTMTQAEYSQRSKGTYSSCETRTLYADGMIARRSSNMYTSEDSAYDKARAAAGWVCKIRISTGKGWDGPDRVIVISDKPQKSIPINWERMNDPAPAAVPVAC